MSAASSTVDEAAAPVQKATAQRAGEPSYGAILRQTYLTIDRRTLGFTRILLGFLMVTDLIRRTPDWLDMYSDKGVLPAHVNLWRPQAWGNFSLLNAFNTAPELWALWAIMLVTFLCVLVGYKTRIAQILAAVFVTSMNGRILLIENGGYVVYNLLAMWTAFLPMGDRFSVDAVLESMRRRKERTAAELNDRAEVITPQRVAPHVSLVVLAVLLQISAIYYFNVIHKTGPAWKNGTAVHFVLYVDRMVTPLIAKVRDYPPTWLILAMTKFVLMAEAALPVCILSPLARPWARRIAIVLMNIAHLGFGSTFVLGPFAWSMCVFSTLLFTEADWNIAGATMRREHRRRVVLLDERSGAQLWLGRLLIRLDGYDLLAFRHQAGLSSLEVEDPATGKRLRGALALADIVAALPLGPAVAWILRLPVVRPIVDALVGALEKRDMSRVLGLHVPSVAAPVEPAEPAPLRRKLGFGVATLREAAILFMMVACVNQALVELWSTKNRWKWGQPEVLRVAAQKLRFLQGWFMFSPNPVMDDGTIVVDAKTIDGRSIDPFTGREPNFDHLHAKSYGYNQIWSDYFNRMHLPANSPYRDAMKEYIYRLPERTGNPNDAIVSGDVYWVKDMNPPFGKHESYKEEREKLFSFENPNLRPQTASN
jgi:hypothetical protein